MPTFESTVARAQDDLRQLDSAIGVAEQVLEVASISHRWARRAMKVAKIALIIIATGGVLIGVVLLVEGISRRVTTPGPVSADRSDDTESGSVIET